MRVRTRMLLSLVICLLALSPAVAQKTTSETTPIVQQPRGALESVSDALRARGIGTSEPSLISALLNKDQLVRSLAALQLAQDHDYAAIPSIKAALKVESNPKARIAMSEALWGLHDPKGLPSLQAMCTDPFLSIYDLVDVVQHLATIGESSEACATPIIRYLKQFGGSTEANEIVLPALPDLYKWVSPNQAGRIVSALQEMLSDRDGSVRIRASHGLVQIRSRSSIAVLRDAASRETDPVMRSALESDVSELEKPTSSKRPDVGPPR